MSDVSYRLSYTVLEYSRRGGHMSSLLFSLAQQALRLEERGQAVEQIHCHLAGDGDYVGIALVDAGGNDAVETAATEAAA